MNFKQIINIKQQESIEEILKFSLLNIDKPSGCTSFDVVHKITKIFGIKKAGHLGTLDPNVTGVLPICLNDSCKIQDFFMHQNKTYTGKMLIHKKITKQELEKAMSSFIGKINQLPPRVSRVKRVVREREVVSFKLLSYDENKKEASFLASVEAGTYIRKLIDDLGKSLGVGAQMTELRRIQAGLFSEKDKTYTSLENLERAVEEYKKGNENKLRELLIPAEIITELLPVIEVKSEFEQKLKNGSPIFEEMLESKTKKKNLEIIDSEKPFCIIIENKLIEICQANKEKSKAYPTILAWPKVVLR